MNRRLVWLAGLVVLSGCAAGPDYTAPRLDAAALGPLPSAADTDAPLQRGVPPALWWRDFADPQLDALIGQAWTANHDLATAAARVEVANEELQVARAGQWPGATLQAGGGRQRLSATDSPTGSPAIVNPVRLLALFDWELDLFGRVRRTVEAAQASAGEVAALRDDLRRLILAQVLEAYVDLRGAQMQAACLQQQLDNQNRTLALVRNRESAGRASAAERVRFEAQVSLVAARLPAFRARERAARNRLATLTGLRLDAPQVLALDTPQRLVSPARLLTDEPASLLARRPDVRAAERALAAATARQGVAAASPFPAVRLSLLLGLSGAAGAWRSAEARTWGLAGNASWAAFDGGASRAQVRAAGAAVQAAWAQYDKTVAAALEESDTAVSDWVQSRQQVIQLGLAGDQAEESARRSRVRYQEGAESLLGVLDAEHTALAVQEQWVAANELMARSAARSYLAMAGGLDPTPP